MEQQLSKKERDTMKAERRVVHRVTLWVLAAVLIIGSIAGLVWWAKQVPQSTGANATVSTILPDDHVRGPASSTVTLVEYADFQCPACAAYHPVIKQLITEYEDRVQFVYRHFPLPQHVNAKITAQAAEAAGEQGKFWEMQNLIFSRQDDWTRQSRSAMEGVLSGYAKELGLDMDRFNVSLTSTVLRDRIVRDVTSGQKAGVTGTPTFFLNGEQVYPRSIEEFRTALNQALATANSNASSTVQQ